MNLLLYLVLCSSILLVGKMFASGSAPDKIEVASLCKYNDRDATCWVNKASTRGISTGSMDAYLCMNQRDFTKIVTKLRECAE
jgi:hypothetical protein